MSKGRENGDGETRRRQRRKRGLSSRTSVFLWEFLLELLSDTETNNWIMWIAREEKIFQIKNVTEVAKLWGTMKGKPELNKQALLRSIRYYYRTNVIRKVPDIVNAYQFLELPYSHPLLT